MMRKLVDPIHFFDSRGHSYVNGDHLSAKIEELTADNERLKKLLVSQVKKTQALQEEIATPQYH